MLLFILFVSMALIEPMIIIYATCAAIYYHNRVGSSGAKGFVAQKHIRQTAPIGAAPASLGTFEQNL